MWFCHPWEPATGAAPKEEGESSLPALGAHGCVVSTGCSGRKAAGSQAVGPGQAGQEMEGGEAREGGCRGEVTTQGHTGPGTLNLGLQLCLVGTTYNSESLKQKGAVGLWGSQARF